MNVNGRGRLRFGVILLVVTVGSVAATRAIASGAARAIASLQIGSVAGPLPPQPRPCFNVKRPCPQPPAPAPRPTRR